MAYCSECGAELKAGSKFCFRCGASTAPDAAVVNSGAAASGGPSMSTAESIKLANELHNKYAEYEKSEHDITDMEKRAKDLGQNLGGQVSGFRYFWPTLIVAPLTFIISRWIIGILYGAGTIRYFEPVVLVCIPYGLLLLVIVLGIIIAVKNTNSANANIEAERASNESRRKKLLEEVEVLKENREALGKELAGYEYMIPEEFRNSASMTKIKHLLNTGKAKDFKEAIHKALFC